MSEPNDVAEASTGFPTRALFKRYPDGREVYFVQSPSVKGLYYTTGPIDLGPLPPGMQERLDRSLARGPGIIDRLILRLAKYLREIDDKEE